MFSFGTLSINSIIFLFLLLLSELYRMLLFFSPGEEKTGYTSQSLVDILTLPMTIAISSTPLEKPLKIS